MSSRNPPVGTSTFRLQSACVEVSRYLMLAPGEVLHRRGDVRIGKMKQAIATNPQVRVRQIIAEDVEVKEAGAGVPKSLLVSRNQGFYDIPAEILNVPLLATKRNQL